MIFLRTQATPYVILFIERDGSTYLTSMMMEHPDVQAVYEQFAVLRQKNAAAADQLAWAEQFLTPPLVGKKAALGFKTKLVDVLDLPGFTQLLQRKGVRVIQMRRRNMVKAVVSRINARRLYEASGKWNLYKESDRMPAAGFDPEQFDQYLKEREASDRELNEYVARLDLPKLHVEYEDLLVNRDAVLGRVFEFLRIRPFPVQGKTLKHTGDDLHDVVLNFDELRGRYAGTVYAPMFDEVLVQG
jgi:LPS sulfotransferase NodH